METKSIGANERMTLLPVTVSMLDELLTAMKEREQRLKIKLRIMDGEIIKTHEMPNRWEHRQVGCDNPLFRSRFYCPDCHDWQTYGEPAFCPMCGAYMLIDEEDEDDE